MVEKGMRVIVQPCTRRVYNDAEYSAAGAELSSDLSPASVILGVKQVPQAEILNDKTSLARPVLKGMAIGDGCAGTEVRQPHATCCPNRSDLPPPNPQP